MFELLLIPNAAKAELQIYFIFQSTKDNCNRISLIYLLQSALAD